MVENGWLVAQRLIGDTVETAGPAVLSKHVFGGGGGSGPVSGL